MSADRDGRPRDVVHVIDSLGRSGGAEQQLIANLRRFGDERLRHRILCLYEGHGDTRRREVPDGVEVEYLSAGGARIRNRLVLIGKVHSYVRRRAPDLIHCTLPDAALAARVAGRIRGVPVIETLVNISHEAVRTEDNPVVTPTKLAGHRLVDRWTMRWVARFQALSRAVADSWVEEVAIPRDRIVVIPRGVDAGEARSAESRQQVRAELLAELGLDEEAFLILNIGRQVAQKGQIHAIRAMPSVLDQVPSAAFVSAGSEGGATAVLREDIDRLGIDDRVRFLGVRDDIPRLLAAGDVFVFPSLYEGLGVSLLEAMAAGLACVTTDRRPMTEVVSHEVNGLVAPARDSSAIASALIRLARDPDLRSRLGSQARRDVIARYDSDDVARQVEALFLETLNLAPGGM